MKQFDLYANTDKATNKIYPYFVDAQNDLIAELNSRVVILLTKDPDNHYPEHLCPRVSIDGNRYALLTQQITSVSSLFLKKRIGSLSSNRNDIVSALNFLITGI